jgi:hypothetical protein
MKQVLAAGAVLALVSAPCLVSAQQIEGHGFGGSIFGVTDQNRPGATVMATEYCKGLLQTLAQISVVRPPGLPSGEYGLTFTCTHPPTGPLSPLGSPRQ